MPAETLLYKNKYRHHTARAQWWDYGKNAAYFITICTQNREHWFGEIKPIIPDISYPVGPQNIVADNVLPITGPQNIVAIPNTSPSMAMYLSPIGQIAEQCWFEIPQHFSFVHLDAFVVMPNHVHGILVFDKPVDTTVGPQYFAAPPPPGKNQFGQQSQNLASVIRGYKIGVTKGARQIEPGFSWQTRYHDHIIRDAGAYQRIANYIETNPARWHDDKFYVP